MRFGNANWKAIKMNIYNEILFIISNENLKLEFLDTKNAT